MAKLTIGDLVEVASSDEILETLDANGTLNGLPFMPEMLEYCGKRFRLATMIQKTCVESSPRFFDVRGFRGGDVWVLDELRCSGAEHDECGRRCLLFWRAAWLRKVEVSRPLLQIDPVVCEQARSRLKTFSAPGVYFCQSTELVKATESLSKSQRFLKCIADIRAGAVGVFEMLVLVARWLWWKTVLQFVPRHLVGPLTRTPVSNLSLAVGEVVEVKSAHEIVQTLDRGGCTRGLRYDRTLNKFGGKEQKVLFRLDRMISEPTGKMLTVGGTVMLEGAMCPCYAAVFGGCPRKDFVYWREVWLKRAGVSETETTALR